MPDPRAGAGRGPVSGVRDPEPGPAADSGPATDSSPARPMAETPDLNGAYPRLSDPQIAALSALGQRRPAQPEEILFAEGDRNCDFFVVLGGLVAVVEGRGTPEERVISVHGCGRFLGELGLLTGEASYYSAVPVEAGEVLAVPADRLRELVAQDPALGDLILRACLIWRSILIGLGAGLRIIGSRYSPDTRRLRDFAARNRVPARWLDLEADPAAETLVRQLGVTPEETPIVLLGGQLLRNPSNAELAAAIGLPAPGPPGTSCDLLVVGSGPAGLSAAVYGASEGLETVVLDGTAAGGQAGTTSRIENYLGFPSGISGAELAERAVLQARKFGAHFAVPAEATSIRADDESYTVQLDDGTSITATSVVLATGARYRRLPIPRLDYFEQMSVYYAASQAEAQFCAGDPVAIVGGGNSAGQAAVFLSRYAEQVTLVVREHDLGEYMSRYLIDQVRRIPNVRILLGTEMRELLGDQALEAITIEDRQTGERRTLPARALFIFIGMTPCTGWLGDLVELDEHGFVRTGQDASLAGGTSEGSGWRRSVLETSRPGIYAVGDVRSGSAKRVASAVGEGAMAIWLAFERVRPA
jgi:thioredoxin reductase (NADPH)